ncbi:ABC transporter [Halovivax asiaticus JCM 14624]|uniref:ABC transporter n=1 Tax=Halovivax asiaticus JCM 14624 TaxID=1227490 RepID=M0BRC3_9EURY|nr:ABC transporter ATP-binding protein [Halovivax asiaticus]ELZ12667.1 ABC transporter [Halovivax asiaticus JCM 14624]
MTNTDTANDSADRAAVETVPSGDRTGGDGESTSPESAPPASPSTDPIVEARGLTKTYGSGDDAVTAVDDVDLAIERGTVVGILGPNGAGKTTTIKLLLGLILPDAGEALTDGVDVIDSPRVGYRAVGAMLEGARNVYWRLTVRENVRYFARLGDRPADPDRIDALIEQVGLTQKADTTVNELSRGMKQKTSLACTLVRETPVVFLDEPTLGLDVESSLDLRRELRTLVDEEERTVILSSHDMDVIEAVCDRVVIMNEGRVVADETIDDLLSVFRTQSYRVRLDGTLTAETKSTLESTVNATDWVEQGETTQFDAPAVQGDAFHEMLATIRTSQAAFRSVDLLEPDLEEIFLDVTDSEDDE